MGRRSMSALQGFAIKLVPALLYVVVGYIVKRFTPIKQRSVASLLFYVLIPLIVFKGAAFSDLAKFSGIALFSFLFGCTCAAAAFPLRARFKEVVAPGMLMCLFSCFNIGWFGIPLVLAVLGDEAARVMTALYVGGTLYGNTIGYVLASNTAPTRSAVFRKLLSIPALYGFLVALAFQPFPNVLHAIAISGPGSFTFGTASFLTSLCGMGLVGMSMVGVNPWTNLSPVLRLLSFRLLVTSALVGTFVLLSSTLALGTDLDRRIVALLPCLPIAANLLVFVSKGNEETHFVGLTLFASTIISFVMLPFSFLLGIQ